MPSFIKKVFGRLFPNPEDGPACTEAAFDEDFMPEAMKKRLQEVKQRDEEKKRQRDAAGKSAGNP